MRLLPLVAGQGGPRSSFSQQGESCLEFSCVGLESLAVDGEAAHQVLAQGLGRPLPEPHSALRIDSVTDREDAVEVVVFHPPLDATLALGSNY